MMMTGRVVHEPCGCVRVGGEIVSYCGGKDLFGLPKEHTCACPSSVTSPTKSERASPFCGKCGWVGTPADSWECPVCHGLGKPFSDTTEANKAVYKAMSEQPPHTYDEIGGVEVQHSKVHVIAAPALAPAALDVAGAIVAADALASAPTPTPTEKAVRPHDPSHKGGANPQPGCIPCMAINLMGGPLLATKKPCQRCGESHGDDTENRYVERLVEEGANHCCAVNRCDEAMCYCERTDPCQQTPTEKAGERA